MSMDIAFFDNLFSIGLISVMVVLRGQTSQNNFSMSCFLTRQLLQPYLANTDFLKSTVAKCWQRNASCIFTKAPFITLLHTLVVNYRLKCFLNCIGIMLKHTPLRVLPLSLITTLNNKFPPSSHCIKLWPSAECSANSNCNQ